MHKETALKLLRPIQHYRTLSMEKAAQPLRYVSREYQIYCSSGSSSYTNSRTQHGGEDTYTGKVIESNCISTGNAVTHIMDYAVRCSELNYLS